MQVSPPPSTLPRKGTRKHYKYRIPHLLLYYLMYLT